MICVDIFARLIDVSVEVQQGEDGGGVRRPFNGLVTDLHEGPPITRGLRSYAMTIRPQMWLLSRRSDCGIWMDKTSVDVVETLFFRAWHSSAGYVGCHLTAACAEL